VNSDLSEYFTGMKGSLLKDGLVWSIVEGLPVSGYAFIRPVERDHTREHEIWVIVLDQYPLLVIQFTLELMRF
jgi:hypothetical protein